MKIERYILCTNQKGADNLVKDTYDEKILLDLILLDGEVCKRFCASVLNKDIKIKQIYKHQIFSIILLLKYFEDVR